MSEVDGLRVCRERRGEERRGEGRGTIRWNGYCEAL
jgi:hypothetical protein